MKEDCVHWPTGCGQPICKPRHLRLRSGGVSFPSYCDFCRTYEPVVKERQPEKVIVRYQYINLPEPKSVTPVKRSIETTRKGVSL